MEAAERWRRSLMRLSRRTLGQVLDTLAISDARRVSRLKGSCVGGLFWGRGEEEGGNQGLVEVLGGCMLVTGVGRTGGDVSGRYRWHTVVKFSKLLDNSAA
jgi:hypothetical protein